MSSDDIAEFFTQTVTVATLLATTGRGTEGLADPVDVDGLLTQKVQLVRDAQGQQVTSSSTFAAPATDADKFPPGSLVTLPGEDRARTVIQRSISAGVDAIDGLDHVTVYLQ